MEIANNILKGYLQNVYFITGTAYAGKSTMVKMLAERFDLIACGENYHSASSDKIATPQNESVDRFFKRDDPEKRFLLEQIEKSPTPEETYQNFKNCVAAVNSAEVYNEYANSGFFTYLRTDFQNDTREQVLNALAKHFGFVGK